MDDPMHKEMLAKLEVACDHIAASLSDPYAISMFEVVVKHMKWCHCKVLDISDVADKQLTPFVNELISRAREGRMLLTAIKERGYMLNGEDGDQDLIDMADDYLKRQDGD